MGQCRMALPCVSKKWLCHFFDFFLRHTARRLRLCAAVCSGKDGVGLCFVMNGDARCSGR